MSRSAAILPAAGTGSRVGAACNKLLLELGGEPLLLHTLRAVAAAQLDQVVLVCRDDERPTMADLASRADLPVTFATGGATRQESVSHGLAALAPDIELVAVHDGARPLVSPLLFHAALASAALHGSGVVALPVVDTLKTVRDGLLAGDVDRSVTWAMQTPQAARADLLRAADAHARATGFVGTDEASLLTHLGEPVHVVPGSARNLKVTTSDDFALAQTLLGATTEERSAAVVPRIGFGFDIHRTARERELWLGGVRIESEFGLDGHSDADALLHAICDALLGAIGAGDIGRHFPDTDPAYRGIASIKLLTHVHGLLVQAGYRVVNIDATLVAERPKIMRYVPEMVRCIAAAVQVEPECVNIKATTNERLDDLGQALGMAAHAVAAVVKS